MRIPVGAGDLQCQVRVLKRHLSEVACRALRAGTAGAAAAPRREPEPHLGGSRGPAALRGAITALARYGNGWLLTASAPESGHFSAQAGWRR